MKQEDHSSFRHNEVHDIVGAEIKAVREAVGIMDVIAFTKVLVQASVRTIFWTG